MKNPHIPHDLDKIFEALANQHRREIIYVLGLQPCSIHKLASMRNLSLQAIHKHIKILKTANLVQDKKIGRIHFLTLKRESLHVLQDWLMQYHAYWGNNNETLENYTKYLNESKSMKGGEKNEKICISLLRKV
jgi:DNA-binding transcriptional ArsR family regulator